MPVTTLQRRRTMTRKRDSFFSWTRSLTSSQTVLTLRTMDSPPIWIWISRACLFSATTRCGNGSGCLGMNERNGKRIIWTPRGNTFGQKRNNEVSLSLGHIRRTANMEPIKHRYDFVLLFDVINGNPNGD